MQRLTEDGNLDDLRKFQKQLTDTISQRSKEYIDHTIIEKDSLSDALLPDDVPMSAITRRHLYPAKTLGNCDCLYKAVSLCLRGTFIIPVTFFKKWLFYLKVTGSNKVCFTYFLRYVNVLHSRWQNCKNKIKFCKI